MLSDGDLREALRRAPCTRGGHHAYLGGLIEHTVAVATLALETCALHPRLDSDLLVTAAILHDIGKIREFELGAEIALSDEGRPARPPDDRSPDHLRAGRRSASRRTAAGPLHCVLGHHGPNCRPGFRSAEALALYRLNALDAGVKGARSTA